MKHFLKAWEQFTWFLQMTYSTVLIISERIVLCAFKTSIKRFTTFRWLNNQHHLFFFFPEWNLME